MYTLGSGFLHSVKCRMNVRTVSVLILFVTYFHSRHRTSCEHLNQFSEAQWHGMLGLWARPFLIGTLCRFQHQPTFTDFTFDDMMCNPFHCYVALSRRLSSSRRFHHTSEVYSSLTPKIVPQYGIPQFYGFGAVPRRHSQHT